MNLKKVPQEPWLGVFPTASGGLLPFWSSGHPLLVPRTLRLHHRPSGHCTVRVPQVGSGWAELDPTLLNFVNIWVEDVENEAQAGRLLFLAYVLLGDFFAFDWPPG